MEFHSHTLPNGLEVIAECNDDAHSIAVGFFVKTGSRDETDDVAGVSHFLEHMCFKGSKKRDAARLRHDVDAIGALWNAYTWWEGTAYFHWLPAAKMEASLEILCDMMAPVLPPDEFVKTFTLPDGYVI